MQDKFTNQEEQLRAFAEDFSLDIDTSELWNQIEDQLPPVKEEKRRPIVWWFASAILVVLLGVLVMNNVALSEQNAIIADLLNDSSNRSEVSESIIKETKHTDNSPLSTNIADSNTNQTTSIDEDHLSATTTQLTSTVTKSEKSPSVPNSSRYDDKTSVTTQGITNQSPILPLSIDALINPSAIVDEQTPLQKATEAREVISFEMLNSKSLRTVEFDSQLDLPLKVIQPLRRITWMPYVSIFSGVNGHRSSIYSNLDEGLDLTQFENESALLGLSSDLQIGYENSRGWRFGLGINHTRLVSRYTRNETTSTTIEVQGNTTSKIDSEGNETYLTGPVTQSTITNYDLNWHRTHDLVNLELTIGKRIFGVGSFSLFADGAIGKNMWSRHTGYYYTEGNETVNKFTANEKNPYSNSGYNLGMNLALEYEIDKISVSLRPFAKMGLNSITQNSNYYQLKNSQYGIQLGVVYRP